MKLLFIGDVVGRPGRQLMTSRLPELRQEVDADVVIANGENAVGAGITPATADELFAAGVDVITLGNHTWDKREISDYLGQRQHIIRPANYSDYYEPVPGRGWTIFESPAGPVAVINIMGRVFMTMYPACPFQTVDEALEEISGHTPVVFIDIHAEATSEKQALGRYVDGRATAVVGTHTHVQTADDRILPGGTAFLSDAGMTGPVESVIGVRPDAAIKRFITQRPTKYEAADGDRVLSGVLVKANPSTGQAESIRRIYEIHPPA